MAASEGRVYVPCLELIEAGSGIKFCTMYLLETLSIGQLELRPPVMEIKFQNESEAGFLSISH
jgi:hypothetical protein